MKQRLLKRWWVILLVAAIVGVPFAVRSQTVTRGEAPATMALAARDESAAMAVVRQVAALEVSSPAAEVEAARAAFDALPYTDRYALAQEADKLAALEQASATEAFTEAAGELPLTVPDTPPGTRLEILLAALSPNLDESMADLLHIAYTELTPEEQAALPDWALERYLAVAPQEEATPTEEPTEATAAPTTAPYSGSYLGSKSSDKYHKTTCSSAKRIKEENKVFFATTEEARQSGYAPCGVCNP